MDQLRIDKILSTDIECVKNGLTRVHAKTHRFPATYVLLLVECGKYYIGSTNNLYKRIYDHRRDLERNEHANSSFQKAYNAAENKSLRLIFIRVESRKEGYEIEQLLLDKHIGSGLLFNVFNNAEVNGHGGKWSEEAKVKQSKVGKRAFESGKMDQALAEYRKRLRRSVSIDGVLYPSLKEASRAMGITYAALVLRFAYMKKANSKYRGKYYYI